MVSPGPIRDPSLDATTNRDTVGELPRGAERQRTKVELSVAGAAAMPAAWQDDVIGRRFEIVEVPLIVPHGGDAAKRLSRLPEVRASDWDGQSWVLRFRDALQFDSPTLVAWDGTWHGEVDVLDGVDYPVWVRNHVEDAALGMQQAAAETIRQVLKHQGNHIKDVPGTVTTFGDAAGEAVTADNSIKSEHGSDWPAARDGTNILTLQTVTSAFQELGYEPTHNIIQNFKGFVTSAISPDVVSSAIYSLVPRNDFTTQGFLARLFSYDWSPAVATSDWRTKAQLDALTKLQESDDANTWVSATRESFNVSDATANNAAVNTTGTTYYALTSDDNQDASAPASRAQWNIYTADADLTNEAPHLVVTHAAGGPGVDELMAALQQPVMQPAPVPSVVAY